MSRLDLRLPAGKSNQVRLFDIFVLGPTLLYIGSKTKAGWMRNSLLLSGAWTIAYNWHNYRTVCAETERLALQLQELGERPSYDRSRLVRPDDFQTYVGCNILT